MSLIINNLCFAYGRIEALRRISVRTTPGRVVAVLGPNAAGKSTLLRCLIGALKPASGSVALNGADVHRLRPRAVAERIAYVPQRSIVSAAFSVQQVVELGRYALTPDHHHVAQALSHMDLAGIAHRPYRALSIGQQQRVTLARALAQLGGNESQGLLVLDEPTAAMDLQNAAQALRLIRGLADRGCMIVLALHDLAMAAAVADESWLLQDGRLVAAGPTCDVLEATRLREVFGVGFAWMADQHGKPRLIADSPFASTTSQPA